jgi:hypothetical protein
MGSICPSSPSPLNQGSRFTRIHCIRCILSCFATSLQQAAYIGVYILLHAGRVVSAPPAPRPSARVPGIHVYGVYGGLCLSGPILLHPGECICGEGVSLPLLPVSSQFGSPVYMHSDTVYSALVCGRSCVGCIFLRVSGSIRGWRTFPSCPFPSEPGCLAYAAYGVCGAFSHVSRPNLSRIKIKSNASSSRQNLRGVMQESCRCHEDVVNVS